VEVMASMDGVEGTAVMYVVERARLKWSVRALGPFHGVAIGEDGTLYVSGFNGLQAVGAQGDVRWEFPKTAVRSIPTIGDDGTIYLATRNGLLAVDGDGNEIWVTPMDGISSSPAIGADGTVYQISGNGLNAVDPTGKIQWSFEAHGEVFINRTSPAIGNASPEGGCSWPGAQWYQTCRLDFDGGSRSVDYFASAEIKNDTYALPLDRLERYAFRSNLGFALTPRVEARVQAAYTNFWTPNTASGRSIKSILLSTMRQERNVLSSGDP
jgi:outer membrane protein assembly factor BamB